MLNWLLGAALLAGAPQGQLTVRTPQLEVAMTSQAAWTISTLSYGGDKLILPLGGQGAMLSSGGKWYGAASSSEQTETVSALSATADGKEVTLALPQTITGDTVTVRKQSTILALSHQAETTFSSDRIVQRHRFEATESLNLASFYAFVYSFAPVFKHWLAQPAEGELLRGELSGDKGTKPNLPVRWMAQYDPGPGKGVLLYYQQVSTGPGACNGFWDTTTYRKALAQPLKGAVAKGTKLDLTLVMQYFSAAPEGWETRAQELAAQLATAFPQSLTEGPARPRVYAEGVPEDGQLVLKSARYTVPFSAAQGWTIYKLEYQGQTIAHEHGFYGTVLIPEGSNFIGTGHTEGGREIVKGLRLTVDGQERPVKVGETLTGKTLTLTKQSSIWLLDCTAEVTVSDEGIYERTRLTAREPGQLKLLYYFMHCFVPTTKAWLAELPDGTTQEGRLDSNGDFEIGRDTRWVSQYDPSTKLGLLCYTPRVISGPGSSSRIWDLERYHKYYLTASGPQALQAGQSFDYTVVVRAVAGETADFAASKAAAAQLKQLYPPE